MTQEIITASELRIGNTIEYYCGEEMSWEISHVDELDIDWLVKNQCDWNRSHRPIVITESIMISFGFTKENFGFKKTFKSMKSDYPQDLFSLFDFNYGREGGLNLRYNVAHGPAPTIKFAHQLQNLYFVLTGEELVWHNSLNPSPSQRPLMGGDR